MTPYHGLDRPLPAEPSPASASRPASRGSSGSSPDAGRRHDLAPLPRFEAETLFDGLDPDAQTLIGAWAVALLASRTALAILEAGAGIGAPRRAVNVIRRAHQALERQLLSPEGMQAAVDIVIDAAEDPSAVATTLGPICRSCGCSAEDACPPTCGWAEDDGLDGLCSACAADDIDPAFVLPCEVRLPSADGSVLTVRAGARLQTLVEALRAREAAAHDAPLLFDEEAAP